MTAFYNEIDPFAAAWTRNLIAADLIAPGVVDERSIADLKPEDLRHATQAHFFSGIAVWSHALRRAGWPDDVPIFSGSCPCFPAGTLILTRRGHLPIEEVVAGDEVLTHRARWRVVTRVGSDNSDCVKLKGQGHPGLVCTPDHPLLAGPDQWEPAKNMKGRRWATVASVPEEGVPELPVQCGVFFDKNAKGFRAKGEKDGKIVYIGVYTTREQSLKARNKAARSGEVDVRGADAVDTTSINFARFLGYWIGDGWTSGGRVFICGSKTDGGLLRALMEGAGMPCYVSAERTSTRASCGSKVLVQWLNEHFGEGAAHKLIPTWLHAAPHAYRNAFLAGYLEADGWEGPNGRSGSPMRRFATVSRALAIGVRMLLNQAGVSASITCSHSRKGTAHIQGRKVNELPLYQVHAYDKARSFKFDALHGWGSSALSNPSESTTSSTSQSKKTRATAQTGSSSTTASRSHKRAAGKAKTTPATSGPSGSGSSASAALQSSLVSKFRVRVEGRGSTLFNVTWKESVTPLGLSIPVLAASARRTSASACTSPESSDSAPETTADPWPIPTVNDSKGSAYAYANGDHDRPCLKLVGAARLAQASPRATPAAKEAGGTPEQFLARKEKARENGSSLGISLTNLALQAQLTEPALLAPWPTATAQHGDPKFADRNQLIHTATLAPWPTPNVTTGQGGSEQHMDGRRSNLIDTVLLASPPPDPGPIPTGSGAATASTDPSSTGPLAKRTGKGQLNPELSRWLMGLPRGWSACAPTRSRPGQKSPTRSRRAPRS